MAAMFARRRFLSFSLRALLICTAVVGGLLGWVVREWRIVEDRRQTEQSLEGSYRGGVTISVGSEAAPLEHGGKKDDPSSGTVDGPNGPFEVPFIRRLLGDEPRRMVIIWSDVVDKSEADAIAAKFPEAVIWRLPPWQLAEPCS
jgi:hypothetical protein